MEMCQIKGLRQILYEKENSYKHKQKLTTYANCLQVHAIAKVVEATAIIITKKIEQIT